MTSPANKGNEDPISDKHPVRSEPRRYKCRGRARVPIVSQIISTSASRGLITTSIKRYFQSPARTPILLDFSQAYLIANLHRCQIITKFSRIWI